jgi:tetratricopeptide (TPR) repeat protein
MLVQQLGKTEGIAVAYNNLGWLHILRGETDEAQESLHKALELALKIGFDSLIREIRWNFGELYYAMEQWEKAQETFLEILPEIEKGGMGIQLLNLYRLLGEIAIEMGDQEQILLWSGKLDMVSEHLVKEHVNIPTLQRGEILRFRGMAAAQMQNWEQSEHDLRRSVDVFRKLRSRLNVGRSLYQLGQAFFNQGRTDIAVGYFDEAAQIFKEIGARLDVQRVETALDALSHNAS